MMHLLFLVLFLAIGFPVALGIELYMRALKAREAEIRANAEFLPIPEGSAVAARRAARLAQPAE
jgi:hypothetical protein